MPLVTAPAIVYTTKRREPLPNLEPNHASTLVGAIGAIIVTLHHILVVASPCFHHSRPSRSVMVTVPFFRLILSVAGEKAVGGAGCQAQFVRR